MKSYGLNMKKKSGRKKLRRRRKKISLRMKLKTMKKKVPPFPSFFMSFVVFSFYSTMKAQSVCPPNTILNLIRFPIPDALSPSMSLSFLSLSSLVLCLYMSAVYTLYSIPIDLHM